MSLLDEIIEFKSKSALREKYQKYIVDKNIPLNDRWAVFKEAPIEWKKTDSCYVTFKVASKLPSREIVWYNDFHKDRYQTVDMVDLVDTIKDNIKWSKDKKEWEGWNLELVEELMEEILSKNLDSFIYDW